MPDLRRPSHVVCLSDWDGTLKHGSTTLGWVRYLEAQDILRPGSSKKIASIFSAFDIGIITYESLVTSVADSYGTLLAGVNERSIRAAAEDHSRSLDAELQPFARPLIAMLKSFEISVIVVTGGPLHAIQPLAEQLGIQRVIGTDYESASNVFTGVTLTNYGLAKNKRLAAAQVIADGSVVKLAVGDSHSDAPLFEAAEIALIVGNAITERKISGSIQIDSANSDSVLRYLTMTLKKSANVRG